MLTFKLIICQLIFQQNIGGHKKKLSEVTS